MTAPLCRDCRHALNDILLPVGAWSPEYISNEREFRANRAVYCNRPDENGEPIVEPVNGVPIRPQCASERAAEWRCGQEGRYFQARET